jgi:hypothetical protein
MRDERHYAIITGMSRACESLRVRTDTAITSKSTCKEDRMRAAFKVATVFTGVAACAAVFPPLAEAVTVPTANNHHVTPFTSIRNCTIGPETTSVVLTRPPSAHHGPTCVGGATGPRIHSLGNTYFSYFCAGNNYGRYWKTGNATPFSFYAGSEFNISAKIAKISIRSWSGGFKCST